MNNSKLTMRAAWIAILAVSYSATQAQDFVRGRVLVKFYEGTSSTGKNQALQSVNARSSRPIGSGISLVELPSILVESSVVAALSRNPKVQFAEVDRLLRPTEIPNDPWVVSQWALTKVNAVGAWSYGRGSSSVIIAVLDSGVELTHPDLASNLVPGYNVFDGNSNAADVYGHGTAVAGVAGAVTNNGLGIASLSWNCKIMPIRITNTTGYATSSTVVAGLDWARTHGARVANISFAVTDIAAVKVAAQAFFNAGGVVTVSAGNDGATSVTPDNPYVLTVTATDGTDTIYSWANRGSNVDLCAPGGVYSTTRNGNYGTTGGTSFSAPLVASLAGLMISRDPSLTPGQITSILESTAEDIGSPGWDGLYASGRINAGRAIEAVVGGGTSEDSDPPTVAITSPAGGSSVSGTVTVNATASDNVGVSSVGFWVDGVQIAVDESAPYSIPWNTTTLTNGTHTVAVKAYDAAGNSAYANITVQVTNGPGDVNPPVVAITAPTQGTVVSNVQIIYAQAVDDVRVAKVELYVDGRLTASSTSAPFTTKWSTRKAARGTHALKLRAFDSSGNSAWSDAVDVVR